MYECMINFDNNNNNSANHQTEFFKLHTQKIFFNALSTKIEPQIFY